jgi:hypothetical protein
MKYKQRILKGPPKRPFLFRSPFFYSFIILLLVIVGIYLLADQGIFRGLKAGDLSIRLQREGKILNYLLFHQFFLHGLKREDVKLTLKKVKKDKVSWNLYQVEILLPSSLPVQQVKSSLEKEIKSSLPDLALQGRLLNNDQYQATITYGKFTVAQLTLTQPGGTASIGSRPPALGKIALVIDDLGPNLTLARELLALNFPLTFSILPFYTHSKEIAQEANSKGREVMLHLPLEPRDNQDLKPEKGTLYTWMNENDILAQLHEDLSSVPCVSGVNGHMGSRFTEDRSSMEKMFRELKNLELYFLDSLTTDKSAGSAVARNVGLRFGKRDIFIDRDLEDSTIADRLFQLAELSKKRGYAIGIAHPYPDTINTLKKILPMLSSEGIEFVPLSEVIDHSAQKP